MTNNNRKQRFNQKKFKQESVVWSYPHDEEYLGCVNDELVSGHQRKRNERWHKLVS